MNHHSAPPARQQSPLRSRKRLWIGLVAAVCGVSGVIITAAAPAESVPVQKVRVVAEYPHDAEAFTQGLVIHDGEFYEGTGIAGKSSLRRVDIKSGKVLKRIDLAAPYFGEGIAILNQKVYQLTWRDHLALIYDLETLKYRTSIRYTGEGWGLTTDGEQLIMSDGTATLKVLKPETFEVVKRIHVRAGKQAVTQLNELEYVNGEIWANIWYSDRIARISPQSGQVLAWIDVAELYPARRRPSRENVLNGIAYDAETKRLFVTGKLWPKVFEIEVLPAPK